MGRYYSGDIDGKFMFAVQSSNAADRFGVSGTAPGYIDYYFEKENLPEIEEEIKKIRKELGQRIIVLENYFKSVDSYRNEYIEKVYEEKGLDPALVANDLALRADLILGEKIRDCVRNQGDCQFQAEC